MYLCTTNILQMKKITLFFIAILSISIISTSCDGGDDPELTVLGDWHTTERTLTTGNTELDYLINSLYKLETKDYDVVRTFGTSSVTTTIIERATGNVARKKEGTYMVENGNTLIVDDESYGRSTSTLLLSNKIMTTTRTVNISDIRNIADELGIDKDLLPAEASGVLKMHEAR